MRSRLDSDDELEDVDLLGAATLAKISPAKPADAAVDAPVADVVEETVANETEEINH